MKFQIELKQSALVSWYAVRIIEAENEDHAKDLAICDLGSIKFQDPKYNDLNVEIEDIKLINSRSFDNKRMVEGELKK